MLLSRRAYVSKKIAKEGRKAGYICRDEPLNERDSGWSFMAGNEDEAYVNDAANLVLMTIHQFWILTGTCGNIFIIRPAPGWSAFRTQNSTLTLRGRRSSWQSRTRAEKKADECHIFARMCLFPPAFCYDRGCGTSGQTGPERKEIIMTEFILLLLVFLFGAFALMKYMKTQRIRSGALDQNLKKVLSTYRMLRSHQEELGTNAFAIGCALKADRGELIRDMGRLSVRILDEKGKRREGAEALGMETVENEGKYYYQICEDLEEKLSFEELTAALVRLKDVLESKYPDELVSLADTYLTLVVDGKKLLQMLEKGRK